MTTTTLTKRRSKLLALAALGLLATAPGCGSKKDKPADPWAGGPSDQRPTVPADAPAGGLGADGLAGADIQKLLGNVAQSLEKPGPYEAPRSSPGFVADKPHLGVLELSGEITELESYSFSGGHGTSLRELTGRLRGFAADANLSGLIVRVGDLSLSLPDALELRAALLAYRDGGKRTLVCHAESAANVTYVLLTACERIALAPLGEVLLSGPAAMPVHLKGLLDHVGVRADFLHVGAYKGAAEPLTRDQPSAEMLEVLGLILDRHYATIVDTVASGRGLTADQVKALIDEAMFDADKAKAAKLADEVATFEAFRDATAGDRPWTRITLTKDDPGGALIKLMQFVGAVPATRPTGAHVALVYAVGDVVDGAGDGVLGAREQIAAHTLVAALRTLAADDDVKAVVLRIDSGGGSAAASELIWHAVSDLKAKKPVIVSMSDVAASGGYYIAAPATKIYALDDTLTGSIGVVGGKLAPGGALAKVGVTTFPIGRGKRSTMFASVTPWTADERAAVQASMESVYQRFLARVAAGRNTTTDKVHLIAQGRVWTGSDGKRLGLVDELGGLDAAIADAQKLGAVGADVPLEVYPPTPTLRDMVIGFGGDVSMPFGLDAVIAAVARDLSPGAAAVAERTVRQLLQLRDQRVLAALILPVLFQ